MKKYIILFIAACQGITALAQDNKTPYLTKSLSGANIKNVYVTTSGGSITVSGASGQEPRVEVYISGNNGLGTLSNDEIKKRLEENYTLDITAGGGELKVIAKNKHNMNWRSSLSIGFKVYVPQNVATKLETSGGSIHLDNLSGQEVFETSGGSLHIEKLTGNIHGRTSGGSITLLNSKDNIDLETSGGSIRASNCSGNIHLETSGGSIRLEDLSGKIGAETSGGSVGANNIKGELKTGTSGGSINLTNLACSLDTYTSGGSIHAQLKEASKFVKIDASGGHVDLELPSKQGFDLNLRADKVSAELGSGSFNGTKEKDRVEGKLNGGGISVDVSGSNRVNLTLN